MKNNLFVWACNEIKAAEKELNHELSWRFLTTPADTLSSNTKIAFIALNPGGDKIPFDHGRERVRELDQPTFTKSGIQLHSNSKYNAYFVKLL